MKKMGLSRQEKQIEKALVAGEYAAVSQEDFQKIAQAIHARRRDAVLHVRINSSDLKTIKEKARRLGVKYQTFISEVLHHVAHTSRPIL